MKKTTLSLLLGLTVFSGAAFSATDILSQSKPVATPVIEVNEDLIEKSKSIDEIANLRLNSIREAVYTVSIQFGMNEAYNKKENQLELDAISLDQQYDFTSFLLSNGHQLPPIISESRDSLKLLSDEEAVASLTTYIIERDSRLVASSLSWRDYLIINDFPVQKINPLLMPKTAEEKTVWVEAKALGIAEGIEQAELIYQDNVARLTRDLAGAIRFHRLLKQGIISQPKVETGKLSSSVSGKTLSVGHTVYRLKEHAIYQEESQWKVKPSLVNH